MARNNRTKYIVIPEKSQEVTEQAQAQESEVEVAVEPEVPEDAVLHVTQSALASQADGAPVVYQLTALADSVSGPLLVVGYGNPMKAVVKACVQAKVATIWVTGTEDKRRGFSFSGAAQVAMLGKTFDKRLFSNEYAIMKAAEECEAGALLLADSKVAESELLLMLAKQKGLGLYVAMEGDKTNQIWVRCETPDTLPDYPVTWTRCPKCKLYHDSRMVLGDHGTCPTCGSLYRLNSNERIAETFDKDSFEEWDSGIEETNPLDFPGYPDLLASNSKKSGLEEAVRCGKASIVGMDVAVCIMEATFMMGSMGSVVGEKITRTVERATALGLPLVIFTASGGARMQEGLVSLMQMAKISAAIERHSAAGLLYVSVITDPTTGGVTASFAMQGDIIISEPHALIGFAGRRVIQDTIKQTLPDEFQTAEFALEHGLIDAIVKREQMRATLAHIIALHLASAPAEDGSERELYSFNTIEEKLEGTGMSNTSVLSRRVQRSTAPVSPLRALLNRFTSADGSDEIVSVMTADNESESTTLFSRNTSAKMRRALMKRGVADAPSIKPVKVSNKDESNPAWESVLLARNVHRPTAQYYIKHMIDGFIELHGDRSFADDGAILAGIGWIGAQPVTIIAEEKGANLDQRIKRNFGCPQPEGYRKSLRLMKQAEKFGRPIVCLVDTQGAFCGMEAEERGQGNAIADNLVAMAGLTIPVVCVVLGEGGSGGALALAVGNRVAMQEHAVYSVLSPEGFASILWKDRSRAAEAAAVMKMSAAEACEMGLIEEVLSEGEKPAHENPEEAADAVEEFVVRSLHELESLSPEELREDRYDRFRAF